MKNSQFYLIIGLLWFIVSQITTSGPLAIAAVVFFAIYAIGSACAGYKEYENE